MDSPEEGSAVEDRSLEEDDAVGEPVRYTVTSFGADLPVDGIVSRLERGDIVIPDFQRDFVWSQAQSSRFIESLLLGIPVPGIFLFKDPDDGKLVVVDGQQRLRTLQSFHAGRFGQRVFSLEGVAEEFRGATYQTLAAGDRRRLDDSIVHATIFQQDEPRSDRSSMYAVFERLNTGGTPLRAQEIRACVYQGPMNDLLAELARDDHWRHLYGPENRRKKEEEIILRFLALYHGLDDYRRPMKRFLNQFMEKHRNLGTSCASGIRDRVRAVVRTVDELLTPAALRPDRAFNVSVADAALVGLSRRLDGGPISDADSLRGAHAALLDRFRRDRLHVEGTTSGERVRARIELATKAYEPVS